MTSIKMLGIDINKQLLYMKMHYFFYSGCIVTINSFGSTYAKQLGYSKITVGYIISCLCVLSMLTKPIVGAIVDKFRVKKHLLLVFILLTGISAFFFLSVPRLSIETSVQLYCDATTMVVQIYSDNNKQLSNCDKNRLLGYNDNKLVCKLNCNNNDQLFTELHLSNKNTSNDRNLETNDSNLTVYMNFHNFSTSEEIGFYNFHVLHIEFNHTPFVSPSCYHPTSVTCQLNCASQTISELASIPKSQQMIFDMPEFWEFFSLLFIFWVSQSAIWTIQDPICFDLLGDKPNDFGKQRCWTSIGWGIVSMLGGWLVDYFSHDDVHKNYTPISYLILLFMVFNFIFASNITVVDFKASKNTCQNVFELLKNAHVISFVVWIILLGIYSSMIMNYLFWYLEDMASTYECSQLSWIKTLQGFSQCLQCFIGELPIFFCSGSIIKQIGHKHCMSLVLFVYTARFFFYSVMTNPVWVIFIEILNGMMYALGRAVIVSYTKIISPPSTHHTVLGLVGLFDCIGLAMGSILAGYIYDIFGGVWLFQSFTYGSAVMCILLIICNLLDKVKL